MRTLISHEIPKQLFTYSKFFNDYPYLLAHLLDPSFKTYDKEYSEHYKEEVKNYPYSILDNSAFELEHAIDGDILYNLGEEYKASHLIIPDSLHNKKQTQKLCMEYLLKYGNKSTPKFIGVLQGESEKDLFDLYSFYLGLDEIDVIALPFDFYSKKQIEESVTKDYTSHAEHNFDIQKVIDERYKLQRPKLVNDLIQRFGEMNQGNWTLTLPKKLHLLGCATPLEFKEYSLATLESVKSVDTSAPIVYGWNNIDLSTIDINTIKPKELLAENLDISLSESQLLTISNNVKTFKDNLLFKTK